MPRITVQLPVSVDLTDEQLEDAQAVKEAVGIAVKMAQNPAVRDVVGRLARAAARVRRTLPR